MDDKESLVPVEQIECSILLIRGEKVMLDADLAALYGVEPGPGAGGQAAPGAFPCGFYVQLSRWSSTT